MASKRLWCTVVSTLANPKTEEGGPTDKAGMTAAVAEVVD